MACAQQRGTLASFLLVKNLVDLGTARYLNFFTIHGNPGIALTMGINAEDIDALIISDDPQHPANHICILCANFYTLGWVHPSLHLSTRAHRGDMGF